MKCLPSYSLHLDQRQSATVASDQGQHFSKGHGIAHSSPLGGRGLENPQQLFEAMSQTDQQAETSSLQEKAPGQGRWSSPRFGSRRGFRLLPSALRALDGKRLAPSPLQSPWRCTRAQECWELTDCSLLISWPIRTPRSSPAWYLFLQAYNRFSIL